MSDRIETSLVENLTSIIHNTYNTALNVGFDYMMFLIPSLFVFQSSIGKTSIDDVSPVDIKDVLSEDDIPLQQGRSAAVKDMDAKLALLTQVRSQLAQLLQTTVDKHQLGIYGSSLKADALIQAIESKIKIMQADILNNTRDKEGSEVNLEKQQTALTDQNKQYAEFLTNKAKAEADYNEQIQAIENAHQRLIQTSQKEAIQAGAFANSFLGQFIDFFTPKFLAGLLGFIIKTNKDIYDEKNTVYSRLFGTEADISGVSQPDFTAEENALKESKQSAQEWIETAQKKIDTNNKTIQDNQNEIESLTKISSEIKSLQDAISKAQLEMDVSMQRVREAQKKAAKSVSKNSSTQGEFKEKFRNLNTQVKHDDTEPCGTLTKK